MTATAFRPSAMPGVFFCWRSQLIEEVQMIKKSKLSFGLTAVLDIRGFGAQVAIAHSQGDLQALLKAHSPSRA